MDLPVMTDGVIAVDAVPETFSDTQTVEISPSRPQAALTARAVIGVSFLGAGCWYLLWKLAVSFVAAR